MKNSVAMDIPAINPIDQLCRNIFMSKISKLEEGNVEIVELFSREHQSFYFGPSVGSSESLSCKISIHHPNAYSKIVLGGSIGSGEGYMDGDWDCDQLTSLIQIMVRNRHVLEDLEGSWSRLTVPARKLIHYLKKNSIKGAKENIKAHYDLGNDFFGLFLGSTWMYSSGYFPKIDSTLEEAQFEKNDRICRKLNLKADDHLLEIGTGWGSFAIHAAKNYGCKVTTTTISKKQYELAASRILAEGLNDQITLLEKDYRLLTGKYDYLVSIEMIEAVGLNFIDDYFEKCSSLLKPDGQMVLQGITIRDHFFENAKKNVDFIQKYIFPGTAIPSVSYLSQAIASKSDLQLSHLEDFGNHYARTLHIWSERLKLQKHEVFKQGYSERHYRMWQYYFSYCEGGFLETSIGVMQMHLKKPRAL